MNHLSFPQLVVTDSTAPPYQFIRAFIYFCSMRKLCVLLCLSFFSFLLLVCFMYSTLYFLDICLFKVCVCVSLLTGWAVFLHSLTISDVLLFGITCYSSGCSEKKCWCAETSSDLPRGKVSLQFYETDGGQKTPKLSGFVVSFQLFRTKSRLKMKKRKKIAAKWQWVILAWNAFWMATH